MCHQEAEALELRLERDQAKAQAERLSRYLQELFDADPAQIPASYGEPAHSHLANLQPLSPATSITDDLPPALEHVPAMQNNSIMLRKTVMLSI